MWKTPLLENILNIVLSSLKEKFLIWFPVTLQERFFSIFDLCVRCLNKPIKLYEFIGILVVGVSLFSIILFALSLWGIPTPTTELVMPFTEVVEKTVKEISVSTEFSVDQKEVSGNEKSMLYDFFNGYKHYLFFVTVLIVGYGIYSLGEQMIVNTIVQEADTLVFPLLTEIMTFHSVETLEKSIMVIHSIFCGDNSPSWANYLQDTETILEVYYWITNIIQNPDIGLNQNLDNLTQEIVTNICARLFILLTEEQYINLMLAAT